MCKAQGLDDGHVPIRMGAPAAPCSLAPLLSTARPQHNVFSFSLSLSCEWSLCAAGAAAAPPPRHAPQAHDSPLPAPSFFPQRLHTVSPSRIPLTIARSLPLLCCSQVEKWEAQRENGTYPGPVPGEKKEAGGH